MPHHSTTSRRIVIPAHQSSMTCHQAPTTTHQSNMA
ncbi:hypothetical protein DQV95_11780 [Staphylococcus aureus]|nr:hypothetical protein LG33_11740 [Staphylococcus aureus]AQQ84788.1 hypothetical protein AYM13_11570 [Staphylococcus aureus]AQQ87715.1 hypothetical protein AYM14_11570 [Staphylococcus aureus]MBD6651990.1 hypothetical protein [Staphylococcus aureus]MBR8959090.1 hypothetical protein [Staphylococcus aureus]